MAFSKSASLVVLFLTFVLIAEVNLQVGTRSAIYRSNTRDFGLDMDWYARICMLNFYQAPAACNCFECKVTKSSQPQSRKYIWTLNNHCFKPETCEMSKGLYSKLSISMIISAHCSVWGHRLGRVVALKLLGWVKIRLAHIWLCWIEWN